MSDIPISVVHKDERHSFQPVAQRCRRHGYIFTTCILTGIVSGFAATAYHFDRSPWFGAFFMLCIATGLVTMLIAPKPRCPACATNVAGELQTFCPECGGSPLEESWLLARRCTSCQKRLTRGKGRSYRVRYCTNCGAYLDEEGL
jgi:hypothetical protein